MLSAVSHQHLPGPLLLLLHARLASTTSTRIPFPYPRNHNPNPHQIFHLPYSASQKDIKARYYELVRYHHPDSVHCRSSAVSPDERHRNFQSIISAYHSLRSGKAFIATNPGRDDYFDYLRRAQQGYQSRARAHEEAYYRAHPGKDPAKEWDQASVDYEMKDRLIILFAFLTLTAGLFPALVVLPWSISVDRYHSTIAGRYLKEARAEAKEYGDDRLCALKKRAKEYRLMQEVQDAQRAANRRRREQEQLLDERVAGDEA